MLNLIMLRKSEQLYLDIIESIGNNTFYPGQKISESTICKKWQVSRGTVREAFTRLAGEGFIVIKPKSGSYIKQKKTRDFIESLETRAALERAALKIIINKQVESDVSGLLDLQQKLHRVIDQKPFDSNQYQTLHYQYHRALLILSDNKRLLQAFDQLPLEEAGLFQPILSKKVLDETIEEHSRIISIITDKDNSGPDWLESLIVQKIQYLDPSES